MKRRNFIELSAAGTLGLLFANSFLWGCTSAYPVEGILGKKAEGLKNFTKEFEGDILCYSTTEFDYKVPGTKLLVFCKAEKVIGLSIKMKRDTPPKGLQVPSTGQVVFDNPFGTRTEWKEDGVFKSLCKAKEYQEIKNYTFYSEYLPEAASVVW